MEKKKKNKIPFDKIDITTATDDDIIRSGLKHNTSKDIVCYFIMFGIFVLAILPLFLRILMPKKITTEEREIVYFKITCYKTSVRDNYELSTTLTSNYRDGQINNLTFDFNYFKRIEEAEDGYIFAEIHELEQIKSKGITSSSEKGKATFKIDFENYPDLKNNSTLKEYTYFSNAEVNYLMNEKGYSCTTNSETKVEVIDIETRKKVK